jgi:hypothetical protein
MQAMDRVENSSHPLGFIARAPRIGSARTNPGQTQDKNPAILIVEISQSAMQLTLTASLRLHNMKTQRNGRPHLAAHFVLLLSCS